MSRLGADAEVLRQSLRRFEVAEIKQLCHKVDHISFGSAAEAIEIVLVQLQAGMPVIVERTASHTVSVDPQPVVFGSLSDWDSRLDGFIDCH